MHITFWRHAAIAGHAIKYSYVVIAIMFQLGNCILFNTLFICKRDHSPWRSLLLWDLLEESLSTITIIVNMIMLMMTGIRITPVPTRAVYSIVESSSK